MARYRAQAQVVSGRYRWPEAFVASEVEYHSTFIVSQAELAQRMGRSQSFLSAKLEEFDPRGLKFPFIKIGRSNFYTRKHAFEIEMYIRGHEHVGEDWAIELAGDIADEELIWLIENKPGGFPPPFKRRRYRECVWAYSEVVPWCRRFTATPEKVLTQEQMDAFYGDLNVQDQRHLELMERRRDYEDLRNETRKRRSLRRQKRYRERIATLAS
jgi:hypothetical protein